MNNFHFKIERQVKKKNKMEEKERKKEGFLREEQESKLMN